MIYLDVLFIIILCIFNWLIFHNTLIKNPNISEKQKSFILSIRSSLTLFGVSILCIWSYIIGDKNLYIQRLAVLIFLSYLISDCIIGKLYYDDKMKGLTGYPHHFIYIIINIVSLFTSNFPFFSLYFLEELPTFILGIGNYNQKYRRDLLFGSTFFITRILYHLLVSISLLQNKLVSYTALIILPLHAYWFWNWTKIIEKKSE